MTSSGSVAGRAALAVGLMIGFYLLALGIAAVLIALPILEIVYVHRLDVRLGLIAIVGGGTILWSILPRWDRFKPPGPRLEPTQHPKLFSEIDGVAMATGQLPPDEVFLIGDVNAWVAQRGGIMGFFSRRVMGVGLPLMQVLSVSELRAVIAHEFGHYYGGDTRLGPWIYKTRGAIIRTVRGLGKSVLQKPFLWYGELFLRISHAVSRRQEFSADALASNVVGSKPLIEGLKKIQVAAEAYGTYWSEEMEPVLRIGFLPPIAEGFRRFSSEARIANALSSVLEKRLQETKTNPYDTHPALPDRIAAVAGLPPGPDPTGEPPSISLLSNVAELERNWLATVATASLVERLETITWEAVVSKALLPAWREAVHANAAALEGATIGTLGTVIADSAPRATRLPRPTGGNLTTEQSIAFFRWLAAAGATLALDRAGWTIEAPPGAPFVARRNGAELRPFEAVQAIANGKLTGDDWRADVERFGVSELPLGV